MAAWERAHVRELMDRDRAFASELRRAEKDRLDAIRAVDVGAVQRAAEVSAQAAATLAAQVATSAETLRTQVAAAATAATVSLGAALEPIQKDIQDLRKAQYEAQGVRAQSGDSRSNLSTVIAAIGAVALLVSVAIAVITLSR